MVFLWKMISSVDTLGDLVHTAIEPRVIIGIFPSQKVSFSSHMTAWFDNTR